MSLAITIVLCIVIIQYRSFIGQIANWGYLGCFIINVLASGTFVIPGFGPLSLIFQVTVVEDFFEVGITPSDSRYLGY